MPTAGDMRERIELQSLTGTSASTSGAVTGDWKTYAAVWASVESLRSGERYRAQQVVAELSHRVLIRWRDGVEHNHRLLWNGRILEVSQMITRRVQNEIEFLCTEKAA